jgi:hypothetical protein
MATLGNVPAEAYTNTVKDSFSGNGSATAFTMSLPTVTNDVRVVVENVIQDPTVAYSVSGTTLTFTSAPPSGTNNIYVVHLGPAVMTTVPPAEIADATTFASSLTVQGAFTSKGIDDNADAVALTIDSSENVLIGKTSAGSATGVELAASGQVAVTRDGAVPAFFRRNTSDGSFIDLNKDGTAVGSIGVTAGDNLFWAGAAGNTKGLYLSDSGVIPCITGGTPSDATSDLGAPTVRFRHAYLSGGIYLGGAVAANYLDSYEEGTWTPAVYQAGFTLASFTARYTKIGRLVTVTCDGDLSGTGNGNDMKISGLPFTSLSNGHASGAGYTQYYPSAQNGSNAAFVPKSGNNDTFVYFQNGNGARYDGDRFSAGFINFTITYFTS